jgi:hypothetical protein
MKNPDEQVADNIIVKFRDAKLLTEKGMSKLLPHLVTGKLSSADWRLAFETDRPTKEEGNVPQSQ